MSTKGKEMNKKVDTVRVCVRMRPLLQHEDTEFWQINEDTNTITTSNFYENRADILSESLSLSNQNKDVKRALMDSIYSPQSFGFDKVYPINSNSQIIYKEMCRELTKSVIKGYNCSIFMYGQTTSGKTFTMLGSPSSPGILPCALRDVFNLIGKEEHPEKYNIYCSYVEIYNENIHDLLTDANYLKLIDDSKYGVVVAGAKRVKINNFEDGIGIKDFGEENRKYRETLINEYSSRSHTIFQIFIESIEVKEGEESIEYAKSRFSCLNLVDLAGSERITEYDPKGEGNGETGYINKSLFVLANVINRLAEGKKNHIPYRDSKLTRLLSQALGGNSLTTIICTVSPAALNYYQTLSTLRFAMRAKSVKLKPLANEYLDDKGKLEYYKNEIRKLKNELKKKGDDVGRSHSSNKITVVGNDEQRDMLSKIMKNNENLSNELRNYKELYKNEKMKSESYRNELEKMKKNYFSIGGSTGGTNYEGMSPTSSSNYNTVKQSDMYIDELLAKITNQTSLSPQFADATNKISNEYKNDLFNLQNNYKNKIQTLQNEFIQSEIAKRYGTSTNESKKISNIQLISPKSSSNNQTKKQKEPTSPIPIPKNDDDIIDKIRNGKIFDSIVINYVPKSFENFEDNVKTLKQTYVSKVDTLEKTMDYYKSYIENFYRKKIQQTRNTNMDSVELIEDNLPIMQITGEHNEMLKKLRELYDAKVKDLETTFFATLRTITAKRMDDMNK